MLALCAKLGSRGERGHGSQKLPAVHQGLRSLQSYLGLASKMAGQSANLLYCPNMSRILIARVTIGSLFLLGCWVAYTQNRGGAPPQLTINKVKDDLYEIEGDGGNVAVYITGQGCILVDDKYDRDYDNIVAQVKSVTTQPVKYIISTHHHEDHSGGNSKFLPAGAEIISTAQARSNIVQHKQGNAGRSEERRV